MKADDHFTQSKEKLFRIIVLLATILFSIQLTFTVHQNNILYKTQLNTLEAGIKASFNQSIESLADRYQLLIDHYGKMPIIAQALKEKDRAFIHTHFESEYQKMRQNEPNLFVMHFFDPKNITILRMHKPSSFGDDLTKIRPIVAHVNQTQRQAHAFEPGKNGVTYRITTPIFDRRENHLGVLEFGLRPTYFTEKLKAKFDVKSQILIKTNTLKHLQTKTIFTKIGDNSLIYSDPIFNNNSLKLDEKSTFTIENKTYLSIPDLILKSYDGQEFGRLKVVKDISDVSAQRDAELYSYITLSLLTYAFFLTFLHFTFRRYQSELSQTEQNLQLFKNSSEKDELTGIFNRRQFNKTIESGSFNSSAIEKFSLIFFDIDHFKKINDQHGHLIGDEVLKEIAQHTAGFIRSDDLFFRWGGEEFAILMSLTDLKIATKKAEQLRASIEAQSWVIDLKISVSLGVTQIKQRDTLKSLQERADHLLYRAKKEGRNTVCFE